MKNKFSVYLGAALLLVGCAHVPEGVVADETFSQLSKPAERLQAQQAIMDFSRTFANPSPESKVWFERLRVTRTATEDPEVKAALSQVILLDPEGPTKSPIGKAEVRYFPSPAGTTPATKLAETERQLDLKVPSKEWVLTTAELIELTKSEDFATAQRASRLLRRMSPVSAAPILWQRLAQLTQRSQVQEVEDELLRLPVGVVNKGAPNAPAGPAPAQKAAWLRIVAVRKSIKVNKDAVLPLLAGPANELTEAAWDAAPYLFKAADRPKLEEAAKGRSERLAPRIKLALERLK